MNLQKYFEIGRGDVPIILSCPHGGYKKPKSIPNKLKGVQIADKNKYLISKQIIRVLRERYKINLYYILSKIHRSKVDLNRPPRSFSALNHASTEAQDVHRFYHEQIKTFYQECLDKFEKCLFIDLHGFTKPHKEYPDIILGNVFGNTLKIVKSVKDIKIINDFKDAKDAANPQDKALSVYWGFSEMIKELSKHFSLDDGLGLSDYNLSYSGGYITHQFYTRPLCNAFQLEVARYIREDLKLIKVFIGAFVNSIRISLK